MSEEKLKIFVVDDDPAARLVTAFAMDAPEYALREFGGGADCLAALDERPDLILVDVEMPGMDGLALCRAIRAAGETHAQVIFLSSHNDLETRMAAYDAGGDDYLVKPCPPQELTRKAQLAAQALEARNGLAQQAGYAASAAFTAMTSLGEMGCLLEFFRATSACEDYPQLAEAVFRVLGQYGLEGVLEIRAGEVSRHFSMHGECTELEKSIISHVGGMERIFQFRDRLVVNYPRIVLLIQNLPLDDPDRAGRLRDHLAMLAEGIQPRLMGMESEMLRKAQNQGIAEVAAELTTILINQESQRGSARLRILDAGNDYLAAQEKAFIHLGLSENQENELHTLSQSLLERLSGLLEEDRNLGEGLVQAIHHLKGLTQQGGGNR